MATTAVRTVARVVTALSRLRSLTVELGASALGNSPSVFRRLFRDTTVILLYHDVSPSPSRLHSRYEMTLTPTAFEAHTEWLSGEFNLIGPLDLISGDYERPAAMVTFDDGASGYFDHAVEILAQRDCPSIVFLNMGPVEGEPFWPGVTAYLNETDPRFAAVLRTQPGFSSSIYGLFYVPTDPVVEFVDKHDRAEILAAARAYYGPFATLRQLEEHQSSPNVYFGNHLYDHANSLLISRRALKDSFKRNHEALSRFPNSIPHFSYPYGQPDLAYDTSTHITVKEAGAVALYDASGWINRGATTSTFHRIPIPRLSSARQLRDFLTGSRLRRL